MHVCVSSFRGFSGLDVLSNFDVGIPLFPELTGNVVSLGLEPYLEYQKVGNRADQPMLCLFNQSSDNIARLNERMTHTRKVFRLFGYLEGREEFASCETLE